MPNSEDSPGVEHTPGSGIAPDSPETTSNETSSELGGNNALSSQEQESRELSYGEGWSQPGSSTAVSGTVLTPAPPPPPAPVTRSGGTGSPPQPPEPPDEDEEEDGMARMSFLEHLEELRKRLLLALAGVGISFFLCLLFSNQLWTFVFQPAGTALRHLGVPPELAQISPMDTFKIMWMELPLLASVFVSAPWILYQVWAFIAPGLYKRERRWAAPFVISSAGLFIVGGLFAYFIAFRYGLEFLLGLGLGHGVRPMISMTEYYDLFVDVMLGVGVIFEIPVLLFLLTLIRVVSPMFLVRHSRYAILGIVALAAVITPTGDVFNLALFATPMIILFYIGIFASYLLVLKRENRSFPWATFLKWAAIVLVSLLVIAFFVARYYGYHLVSHWPVFVR
jgi:sec-independent protein translocase protein TatC